MLSFLMPLLLNFIKHNRLLIIIIALGLFFRFYDYSNRFILNQDQARDISIALYAIRNQQTPLLGSPSSAGPFNFGPLYNYLVILSTFLFPFTAGPWVAFTLLSTTTIIIFYLIGTTIGNKIAGTIFALIAAFSSAQVHFSTDMLNTVIVAFLASLSFLFLAKFLKYFDNKNAFFLAFFIGFAINCHFQSFGLLSLLLSAILINNLSLKQRFYSALVMFFGLVTSFIPLIIFDLQNNFVWSTSVYSYYTQGQNKFYYPVRWLTDIRDFWPQLWGEIITGIPTSGYLLIIIFLISIFFFKKIKKLPLSLLAIILSLFIQIILLRYYKGVRSSEYLIAFHPYFLFLTGFSLTLLYKTKKYLFILLSLIILLASTYSNLKTIQKKSQAPIIYAFMESLNQLNPSSYNFFTRHPPNDQLNLPIFYLLYRQNRISDDGINIGTCFQKPDEAPCPPPENIIYQHQHYTLYNLNNLTSEELSALNYTQYTPTNIYNRLFINYPQALNH